MGSRVRSTASLQIGSSLTSLRVWMRNLRREYAAASLPTSGQPANSEDGQRSESHAPSSTYVTQRGNSSLESLREQIQRDETKKLYPRLVLFGALAIFKDKHKPRQQSEDPIYETRRNFLDSFAYLCDVQKGGSTVTAVALQQ